MKVEKLNLMSIKRSGWSFVFDVLFTVVLRNATFVDDIVVQGIDTVNGLEQKNVHIFVYMRICTELE